MLIGDTAVVGNTLREVTDLILNECGDTIIVWKSRHAEGACMFSVWSDWENGIVSDDEDLKA